MERVNAICRHKLWRESVDEIARLEQDRAFCRHDRAHFLDVARLAYIENLEQGLGVDKELIYAAALLHDIGRHLQYTQNIPHDEAGAQLAEIIMADCGFRPRSAQRSHRRSCSTGAMETGRATDWRRCSTGRTRPRACAFSARRSRSATGAEKRKI